METAQRQWLLCTVPGNGEIIAHVWSSNLYQARSRFLLDTKRWYSLTQVWNGDVLSLYVDSVLQGEIGRCTSGTLAIGDEPIRVGGGAPSGRSQLLFNGSIDDVRIYDRALSAEEIRLLYEAEAELPPQSVTSAKLSPALSHLIDGNGSLEQALPAGSVIARKPGETPPSGYTLFQRNEYNASLVWQERHRSVLDDMPMTVLN